MRLALILMTLIGGCTPRVDTPVSGRVDPRPASELFRAPLITGASVSANWGTASPGLRAARRHTGEESIRIVARSGHPGRDVVAAIPALDDRTVVVALDFLFWDTTLASPAASLEALERLLTAAAEARIPVILGDVPELLPGRQASRAAVNRAIHEACAAGRCILLPLDEIHRGVLADGGLTIDGRVYTMTELVPDGLHLSEVASEYLADRIEEVAAEAGLTGASDWAHRRAQSP